MNLNKKGFTLLELMIVVEIVGILAAIIVPKVVDMRDKHRIHAKYADQMKGASYSTQERLRREEAAEIAKYEAEWQARCAGTTVDTSGKFKLQDGTEVECGRSDSGQGGVNLYDCRDGKTYLGQTNVVKL